MGKSLFQLEEFELLGRSILLDALTAAEEFHLPKLLICNGKDAHISILRQSVFNSLDMHIGIFATRAVAKIDGELEHSEPILQEVFAKLCILLAVALCLGR